MLDPEIFDHRVIEKLAAMQCSYQEIADFLGVSQTSFQAKLKTDEVLGKMVTKARAMGKIGLRRYQMKKAEKGDTIMLIWLGKQYLGQADKQEHSAAAAPSDWFACVKEALSKKAADQIVPVVPLVLEPKQEPVPG